MDGRVRPSIWIWLMVVVWVGLAVFSLLDVLDTRSIPGVGTTLFWVLLIAWIAALPVLLIGGLNVSVLKLAGAEAPTDADWDVLEPLWREALTRAGVAPGRYALRLAEDEYLIHRDLGSYAVTIPAAAGYLGRAELRALIAQRLARQTGYAASLVALCLWAALPLVLLLGLLVLVLVIVRGIGRAFGGAADNMKPSGEISAGIGLVFYLVAFVAFVVAVAFFVTAVIQAGVALIAMIVICWLARRVDLDSSATATAWGFGEDLVSCLTSPDLSPSAVPWWLRPFSTFASPRSHIERIARMSVPGR